MSITAERKAELIKEHGRAEGDTGSPEVQVAIITDRINTLTDHFKTHAKDNHSRRGLLMMVNKRRSLLDFLKREDHKRYTDLLAKLGLRKYPESGPKRPLSHFGRVRNSAGRSGGYLKCPDRPRARFAREDAPGGVRPPGEGKKDV